MKPTAEDFEGYQRVTKWLREAQHLAEVAAGRYELTFSSDGGFVSTEFGTEPVTDELMVQLGWTPTENGGWKK